MHKNLFCIDSGEKREQWTHTGSLSDGQMWPCCSFSPSLSEEQFDILEKTCVCFQAENEIRNDGWASAPSFPSLWSQIPFIKACWVFWGLHIAKQCGAFSFPGAGLDKKDAQKHLLLLQGCNSPVCVGLVFSVQVGDSDISCFNNKVVLHIYWPFMLTAENIALQQSLITLRVAKWMNSRAFLGKACSVSEAASWSFRYLLYVVIPFKQPAAGENKAVCREE